MPSNTVTLEGANVDSKSPGQVYFFALNAQNQTYRGEVVVVRNGVAAKSIADLKGAKVLCAPGPANMEAARAVFAAGGRAAARRDSADLHRVHLVPGSVPEGLAKVDHALLARRHLPGDVPVRKVQRA